MKKLTAIILFALVCFINNNVNGQKWKQELAEDLVTIQNGKMESIDYSICTFENKNTMQIKTSAECPESAGISRDNFVALVTEISTMLLVEMFKETGIPDIKSMDAPIGEVDVEFAFFMNQNGIQIQIKANKESNKVTMTWEQLYKE